MTKSAYNNRWHKVRAQWLAQHPLCVYCNARGLVRAATVVDHIKPHRLKSALNSGDPEAISAARAIFWNAENYQSLCAPCHNSDKQREERGRNVQIGQDGVPISQNHHWSKK